MSKSKRKAATLTPGFRGKPMDHLHPNRTSEEASECAICRILKIAEAAANGDLEACGILHLIAELSTKLLDELMDSGNEFLHSYIASQSSWPTQTSTPAKKRPWLDKLGTRRSGLPIVPRKLQYRSTTARSVLSKLFRCVELFYEVGQDWLRKEDAKIAKPPESFPFERWSLDDMEYAASFRHEARKVSSRNEVQLRYVESDGPDRDFRHELNQSLVELAKELEVEFAAAEREKLITEMTPKAANLTSANFALIDEWYNLGMQILLELTHGEFERSSTLRSLAPRAGTRKENRKGDAKENVKDVRREIQTYFDERLEFLRDGRDIYTAFQVPPPQQLT